MTQKINVLLIFDHKTILTGRTRDWSLFDQIGTCFIPQVVMEEIQFLCTRAVNPEEETKAREFSRFMDNNNWQINQLLAEHPSFIPPDGQNMSKNARLTQSIAKSVYGLAQEYPSQLVVLVSNQQTLTNDIERLNINNLTTLTLAQFTQWLRTKQRPINVSEKMQKMITEGFAGAKVQPSPPQLSQSQPKPQQINIITPSPTNKKEYVRESKVIVRKPGCFANFISSILAILGFSLAGLILWYLIQPNSFNQFWENMNLPTLKIES